MGVSGMVVKEYDCWTLKLSLADPHFAQAKIYCRRRGVAAFSGLSTEELRQLTLILKEYGTALNRFQPTWFEYSWSDGRAPPFQLEVMPHYQGVENLPLAERSKQLHELFASEKQKILFTFVRHGQTYLEQAGTALGIWTSRSMRRERDRRTN